MGGEHFEPPAELFEQGRIPIHLNAVAPGHNLQLGERFFQQVYIGILLPEEFSGAYVSEFETEFVQKVGCLREGRKDRFAPLFFSLILSVKLTENSV
jgi:hypothetical protein